MTLPAAHSLGDTNKQEGGRRQVVIAALGITQILAWGSSYYLPAVLAAPISASTGWTLPWIIGGLSVGLILAGLIAVRAGHAINERGGRPILIASTLIQVVGLILLAMAPNLPLYYVAWLVIGLAMGTGLYDAAFSTLGRLYGAGARTAITMLTLWAGFTSSIAWPLSAFLVDLVGWRQTCLIYAALLVIISLPLLYFVLPAEEPRASLRGSRSEAGAGDQDADDRATRSVQPGAIKLDRYFLLLASIMTLTAVVSAIWFVHLLTLLQAAGVTLAMAVGMSALIGPAQFGARILEMTVGQRFHPMWTMASGVLLITISIGLLWWDMTLPALVVIGFGAGQGVFSIARGTVPLALFGPHHYPVLMGKLAMPGLFAQAIAPSLGAVAIELWGAYTVISLMAGISALALIAVAILLVAIHYRAPVISS